MKTIIKHATVVNSKGVLKRDVFIEDDRFVHAFPAAEADRLMEADGLLMFPGVIDVHTHVDQDTKVNPCCDDFFDGTAAAASGGTTSIVSFVVQPKGGLPLDCLKEKQQRAARQAVVDYSFHLQLTDLSDEALAQLPDMVKMGVRSVKIFLAFGASGFRISDAGVLRLMQLSKELGFLLEIHAENDEIITACQQQLLAQGKTGPEFYAQSRPAICEAEAVGKLAVFSDLLHCPVYIVHLSSREGLAIVREHPGLIAETCPHYLIFDESKYREDNGWRNLMAPPLRQEEDIHHLWQALLDGEIQTIGSDHCPFLAREKVREDFTQVPLGTPGIETLLPSIYHFGVSRGRIPLTKIAETMSENPARIFGIQHKGVVEPGYDADFVLFDPSGFTPVSADRVVSKAGYSLYEGLTFDGAVTLTAVRGRAVYENGALKVEKGYGKFLARE